MKQDADGSFSFFGANGEVLPVTAGYAAIGYSRPKGAKITYQIPDSGPSIGSMKNALVKYTRIVGIDTNTRQHGTENFSVTVVVELKNLQFEEGRWSAEINILWALEFHDHTKPPERIGWRHGIAKMQEFGWVQKDTPLLLVVDSDLSMLQGINKRALPLIDDFLLPEGISLAYASADATTDSPLNGLIGRCDSVATYVMKHVTATPETSLPPRMSAARTPFRSHRYWKLETGIGANGVA